MKMSQKYEKTIDEMLLVALEAYEEMGNTAEEFGSLLYDASCRFYPDPCFSKKYNEERRAAIQNARCNLRKLPFGDQILHLERK